MSTKVSNSDTNKKRTNEILKTPPADVMREGPVIEAYDNRLNLRAIKVVSDGALGSRGAALLAPYSDAPDSKGFFYTRYPRPGEQPPEESFFHMQVWFHRLGTPIAKDRYVIGREFPRIPEVALYHTEARERLDTKSDASTIVSSGGLYAENQIEWAPWLRTTAGIRVDGSRYSVTNLSDPRNSGTATAGIVSPHDRESERLLVDDRPGDVRGVEPVQHVAHLSGEQLTKKTAIADAHRRQGGWCALSGATWAGYSCHRDERDESKRSVAFHREGKLPASRRVVGGLARSGRLVGGEETALCPSKVTE